MHHHSPDLYDNNFKKKFKYLWYAYGNKYTIFFVKPGMDGFK